MMRKTRFMSLVFLVLSVSFFFVPEFREGINAGMGPLIHRGAEGGWWINSAGRIPAATLDALARAAEEDSDALTLAFVALQHPDNDQQIRLANLAADLDTEFTWLFYAMQLANRSEGIARDWIERLQRWDPDNAVPWLAEGAWLFSARELNLYRGTHPAVLQSLSEASEWTRPMRRAYAAPNFDAYHARLFNLVRGAMRKHDLEQPAILLKLMANAPVTDIMNSRTYANLLVFKYGKEAETAGQTQRALGYYRTVARHGERMQAHGTALIEKVVGQSLIHTAAQRMIPLLRKLNRNQDAAEIETRIAGFNQRYAYLSPLGQSSTNLWHALLVILLSALVIIFGLFTLVSVVYTNSKRWMRTEVRGKLFESLTVAENYAPILLFMACLGLHLIYYPYAANFRHYMTLTEEIYDFEPLFWNVLPTMMLLPGSSPTLGIGNPFFPYFWYALAGLLLAIGYILFERHQSSKPFDLKPPKDS